MPKFTKLAAIATANTTRQVFQTLYSAIIKLDLPPGTKVSEAVIAKDMGISRQPVRDAFYRLSEQGLLRIRPQRATVVTHISEQELLDAQFIRTAVEVECFHEAIEKISESDILGLNRLHEQQNAAIKKGKRFAFHELDDEFHRTISEIAGHPNAWQLIKRQKVHLDRVRYMSIEFGRHSAIDEHRRILDCLVKRDKSNGETQLRLHLSEVLQTLEHARATHPDYFE